MGKVYDIESFRIDSSCITFKVNGIDYSFRLSEISPKLAQASEKERNEFTISPSGYGIHWESIDEDLSIKGLIQKS
ncbi:MAG: DUF2442 domain-containing protein [Bacteroidota bacterium]